MDYFQAMSAAFHAWPGILTAFLMKLTPLIFEFFSPHVCNSGFCVCNWVFVRGIPEELFNSVGKSCLRAEKKTLSLLRESRLAEAPTTGRLELSVLDTVVMALSYM